jgi:multiple sugar transport system permease protein
LAPAERWLPAGQRRRAFTALMYGFLVVYAAVSLFPVVWVLLTSFKNNLQALETPPKLFFQPTFGNYPDAVDRVFRFPQVFANSLLVAAAGTAVIIALAVPAGYGISRFLAVRRTRFGLAVISARTIPGVALAIPLFLLMQSAGLIDTRTSVVAANVAFSLPFAIWMIYGFIEAVPLELEEAARLDGASRLVVLLRIVVPLALPGIGATAILTSIVAWREFLFPLVLTSRDARTLPVVVGQFITEFGINWGELCAFAMMTILPVIIFSALVGKYLVQGFTGGGVKG